MVRVSSIGPKFVVTVERDGVEIERMERSSQARAEWQFDEWISDPAYIGTTVTLTNRRTGDREWCLVGTGKVAA